MQARARGLSYSRVAYDKVPGGFVSTVWIGLDFGRDHRGRPRIFETLCQVGGEAEAMYRYATLQEAEAGHEAAVERLSAEVDWAAIMMIGIVAILGLIVLALAVAYK